MPAGLKALAMAAIAALMLAATVQATVAEDDSFVIYGPALPPKGCSEHMAQRAALTAVAVHNSRYHMKCVRLKGLVVFRTLYAGLRGYYLSGQGEGDRTLLDGERSRVGLYMSETDFKKIEGPVYADVVGVAMTCGDLAAMEKNIIMIMGWCHQNDGAFVAVASLHTAPASIPRLTGSRARSTLGDLRFAPSGWRDEDQVSAYARRWMTDIETGNVADFHAISANDPAEQNDYVFHNADSPFATFRGRNALPQMALFVPPADRHGQQTSHFHSTWTDLHPVGTFCFCRTTSCSRLWPISSLDAGTAPKRAYVCAVVWYEDGKLSTEYTIDERDVREQPLP